MNLDLLIKAAAFIEKYERFEKASRAPIVLFNRPLSSTNSEHGYAASVITSPTSSSSASPVSSSGGSTHPRRWPHASTSSGASGTSSKRHRLRRSSSHSNTSSSSTASGGANSRSAHNELEKNRRAHMRYCMDQLKKVVPLGSDSSKHTTLGLLTKARRLIKCLQDEGSKASRLLETERQTHRHLRRQLYKSRVASQCRPFPRSSSESCESSSPLTVLNSSASETDAIDIVGEDGVGVSIRCRSISGGSSSSDGSDRSHVSTDSGCAFSPSGGNGGSGTQMGMMMMAMDDGL